jgi:hypothetical protein
MHWHSRFLLSVSSLRLIRIKEFKNVHILTIPKQVNLLDRLNLIELELIYQNDI